MNLTDFASSPITADETQRVKCQFKNNFKLNIGRYWLTYSPEDQFLAMRQLYGGIGFCCISTDISPRILWQKLPNQQLDYQDLVWNELSKNAIDQGGDMWRKHSCIWYIRLWSVKACSGKGRTPMILLRIEWCWTLQCVHTSRDPPPQSPSRGPTATFWILLR